MRDSNSSELLGIVLIPGGDISTMLVERVQFKQPLVQNAATFLVGPFVATNAVPTKIHMLKHGQNLSERGYGTPKVCQIIVTQSWKL